jgi:Tfp pilus assembly protein PilN
VAEETLFSKLAEAGASFALLAFVVWVGAGIVRTLIDNLTAMGKQLAQSNADLSAALRNMEQSRIEQQQAHQEHLLLLKILVEKVEEITHG